MLGDLEVIWAEIRIACLEAEAIEAQIQGQHIGIYFTAAATIVDTTSGQ